MIYVAHKRTERDDELYEALGNLKHDFIFPHLESPDSFDSRSFLQSEECELVLAEVSEASTGLGIELGWANVYGVKIVCIYKIGSKLSNSLKQVSKEFIEYSDWDDLVIKLKKILV